MEKVIEAKQESAETKCQKCKTNPANEDHTCPYSEELYGDSESLCNCCQDCIGECCDSI